jgi:RHS repeat-associated protein
MTSDGTNTYEWDAENRLVKISYPGMNNSSSFTFDVSGLNTKIIEVSAGSATSIKQFVWFSGNRCEEREADSSVARRFFDYGQTIEGTSHMNTNDHLGSIREMVDSSGNIQAFYSYDPFGSVTQQQGSLSADFQYAGYYAHSRSRLDLTRTRAYSSVLGRFINRDPIEEEGGINLYAYVDNIPIQDTDASGLQSMGCRSVVAKELGLDEERFPETAPCSTCFYGSESLEKAQKHAKSSCCPSGKKHKVWCIVGFPVLATPGWNPPVSSDGSVKDPTNVFTHLNPKYDYAVKVEGGWKGAAGQPSPSRGDTTRIRPNPPEPGRGQKRMCCDTCV